MQLELKSVTLGYRGSPEPVLRDLCFKVEAGSATAIVGPSGSGKTTLLATMGLLLRPSKGEVLFESHEVDSKRMIRRTQTSVSWILQTANVFPRRTAIANAMAGALAMGTAFEDAYEDAMVALRNLGIGPLAHRELRRMSGGEAQRVCVARALASNRPIILADEPTGQLDRQTSQLVAEQLTTARRPGTSLVMVTHDPSVAAYSDEIFMMVDGRLERAQ